MDDPNWPATPLGILYAEDFDRPPAAAPEPVPAPASVLTQADLDAACTQAVQAAREEWQASNAQQRADALAAIRTQLAAAKAEADGEATATAEALVGAALATLAGALPALCRSHGAAEARALFQHLLPGLLRETRVVVRVHSGLAAALQQDIAGLDDEAAEAVTVAAAPLPPGDLRVTWAGGSCTRDAGRIVQGMTDALSQLGLLDHTTQRRMALAG